MSITRSKIYVKPHRRETISRQPTQSRPTIRTTWCWRKTLHAHVESEWGSSQGDWTCRVCDSNCAHPVCHWNPRDATWEVFWARLVWHADRLVVLEQEWIEWTMNSRGEIQPKESWSRKIEDTTYRHYPCPPKIKWKRKEKISKNDEGKQYKLSRVNRVKLD